MLVVDDEEAAPALLHRKYGEGDVFFLNSWAYPGALEADDGPGGTSDTKGGLIGTIFRHIARQSRGSVWITDDREAPGRECDYISFSYFPEADKICLFNVDFSRGHTFFLHHFGICEKIELGPSDFRVLEIRPTTSGKAARATTGGARHRP